MSGPCGTGVGRSVLRCSWAAAGSRAQVWPWAWRRSPSGRTEWEHIRWCPWLEHLLRPPATSASGCDRSSRTLCGELFYGPPPGGLDLQGNRNKASTVHHTRYENVKWEQCSVVGPETDLRGGPAGGDRLFGGPGCSFALWSHKTRRLQSSEPSPGRSWPRPQTLREPSREPAAAGHQTWPLCAEVCPPRYCCWAHWPLHLHEKNTEVTLLLGLFVSALPSIHPSVLLTFEDELLGTVHSLLGDAVVQRRVSAQRQAVDFCLMSQKQSDKVAVGDLAGHVQRRLPIGHPVDSCTILKEHQCWFQRVVHHTDVKAHRPGLLQFVAWQPITYK